MLYGVNEESVTQILEYYSLATEYDKYWYKVSRRFLRQIFPFTMLTLKKKIGLIFVLCLL